MSESNWCSIENVFLPTWLERSSLCVALMTPHTSETTALQQTHWSAPAAAASPLSQCVSSSLLVGQSVADHSVVINRYLLDQ